jgi:citrate synthase
MSERKHAEVRSRNEPFVSKTATRIWYEQPSEDNPFIAHSASCYGYDIIELMQKRSFVDVFYLLFRGELPTQSQSALLESLMILLINPGPRHPATRAAMNVGVGKTNPVHILPIASALLGGEHQGGGEIEESMRFFRKNQSQNPVEFAKNLIADQQQSFPELPGFGRHHGGVNLLAKKMAVELNQLDAAGDALRWGCQLADQLSEQGIGWFTTGIAAAVFADLGFQPRAGGCLFQLLSGPGLVAHGLELANKSITAMPFVKDEDYVIER